MEATVYKVPFPFKAEARAFEEALKEKQWDTLRELRSQYISPENIYAHHHGRTWQSHNASDPDQVCSTESHQHELTINFRDIADHDLGLLLTKQKEIVDVVHSSFVSGLFQLVSETCDKSGNVVKNTGQGFAQQFREMLSSIEFGVDRNGNPVLPTIYCGSGINAMLKEIEAQEPEYVADVERIKQEKIAAALEREAERRGRFVGGSGDAV